MRSCSHEHSSFIIVLLVTSREQFASAGVCNDIPPPGEYTCEQQKGYGKCDEHYIRDWGYCAATCGRCDGALPAALPRPMFDVELTCTQPAALVCLHSWARI